MRGVESMFFHLYVATHTKNFNSFKFTGSESGDFGPLLNNATKQLNGAYTILQTLIVIAAICAIYLGIMYYAKAGGGQEESKAKELVKRGVIGILLLSSLGSLVMLVYNIASGLIFIEVK